VVIEGSKEQKAPAQESGWIKQRGEEDGCQQSCQTFNCSQGMRNLDDSCDLFEQDLTLVIESDTPLGLLTIGTCLFKTDNKHELSITTHFQLIESAENKLLTSLLLE
jgi:hypothetical protein